MAMREQQMRRQNRRKDGVRFYLWWFASVAAMIIVGLGLLHGLSDLSLSGIIAVVAGSLLIGVFTLPVRASQDRP